ncbi:MAG: sensor histidine kinase [Butyrivibrio sp.]|nr:sensor histidine kinase [Acetatifactor muris]MCM1561188.1 sensor histidine kinase [Butyrivibrio sp.]
MSRLKRFFANIRLRERMFLFYLIGGVLPMLLADVYMYTSVRSIMIEQEKEGIRDELSRIADSVSESITVIEDISKRLYFDDSIEHIAFTRYESYEEVLEDYRSYDTIANYLRYYYQEIAGITVYTYNPTISSNEYFVYADAEVKKDPGYTETMRREGAPYWSYESDAITGKNNLKLSRVLYTSDMERMGVVVIEMQNKRTELPITERAVDTLFVYNNATVLHSNTEHADYGEILTLLSENDADSFSDKVTCQGEDYLLSFVKIKPAYCEDFYTVVSLRPYKEIAGLAAATALGNLVPMFLCIAIAMGLILIFSNSFSARVNIFKDELHKAAAGDFDIPDELEGKDEIAELHRDLKSMVRDIQELMDRVVQEQVQKEQLNTRQKEVEFKMLASQINPHFLYNTLETIRMQARVNGQSEIEELTKMLAKLMRRNIQASDSLQTLKSELQLVEYYLKIQDYRFHDRIRYEIVAGEQTEAEKLAIMPLVIQPFVENAYVHGLEAKESGGFIRIRAEAGTYLRITVEDNGCGMDPAKLAEVRRMLNDFDTLDRVHIGICNVSQRIRLKYGDGYGVTVESEAGKGTIVTIKLPVLS